MGLVSPFLLLLFSGITPHILKLSSTHINTSSGTCRPRHITRTFIWNKMSCGTLFFLHPALPFKISLWFENHSPTNDLLFLFFQTVSERHLINDFRYESRIMNPTHANGIAHLILRFISHFLPNIRNYFPVFRKASNYIRYSHSFSSAMESIHSGCCCEAAYHNGMFHNNPFSASLPFSGSLLK